MAAQLRHQIGVLRIGEELGDRTRHHRADVGHFQQLQAGFPARRMQQRVKVAKVLGQRLGGRFADVANAEGKNEAGKRRVFRFFQRGEHVLRRFGGHALERAQFFLVEHVQVGGGVDHAFVDQLLDQLVAESFDVDRAARHEVHQAALFLRAAMGPAAGAARDCFVLEPHDGRGAHRAVHRHDELAGVKRPAFRHKADHFGNHVAGATHDDGVADADILAPHFALVVQGGVFDRHAADEHRRQAGHRGDGAGAPDLHADVLDLGQRFFGRELVRQCKPRRARHEAQLALVFKTVDLVDDAVDFIRETGTATADVGKKRQHAASAGHHRALCRDRQAELA